MPVLRALTELSDEGLIAVGAVLTALEAGDIAWDVCGDDLPSHSIMGGSLLNLHTKTAIADRKIQNISRDRRLFPECRMVFCGDSGQADAQVGLQARRDYGDHVAAVFIHDVVGVDARTRADWAREGVYTVDTWDEAARIAHDLQLISEEGLREVESAVEDARQRGEGPRPRS